MLKIVFQPYSKGIFRKVQYIGKIQINWLLPAGLHILGHLQNKEEHFVISLELETSLPTWDTVCDDLHGKCLDVLNISEAILAVGVGSFRS